MTSEQAEGLARSKLSHTSKSTNWLLNEITKQGVEMAHVVYEDALETNRFKSRSQDRIMLEKNDQDRLNAARNTEPGSQLERYHRRSEISELLNRHEEPSDINPSKLETKRPNQVKNIDNLKRKYKEMNADCLSMGTCTYCEVYDDSSLTSDSEMSVGRINQVHNM